MTKRSSQIVVFEDGVIEYQEVLIIKEKRSTNKVYSTLQCIEPGHDIEKLSGRVKKIAEVVHEKALVNEYRAKKRQGK